MLPASTLLPFHWYPKFTGGETRPAAKEKARKGLTPAAPEPRRFFSSPVGSRTSTANARPVWPLLKAVPLRRSVRSPIPLAFPELVNDLVLPYPPGAAGAEKKWILGLEAVPIRWIVAAEVTDMSTRTRGTATEKSRKSARP